MYGLNDMNPDIMRAELAYRRERLTAEHAVIPTGVGRWLRARRRSSARHTR